MTKLFVGQYSNQTTEQEVNEYNLIIEGNAEPTSRLLEGSTSSWAAEEWVQDGKLNGVDCRVLYLFKAEEITNSDGDSLEAEFYPWDFDHISWVDVENVKSELTPLALEIIQELGQLPVDDINNLGKFMAELKEAGYISYLDASTDYLIVERQQLETIIAELIEIEKDENAHGIDNEGNVNWNDGAKRDGYTEYIKNYCESEGLEVTNDEVQKIHGRVLEAIE